MIRPGIPSIRRLFPSVIPSHDIPSHRWSVSSLWLQTNVKKRVWYRSKGLIQKKNGGKWWKPARAWNPRDHSIATLTLLKPGRLWCNYPFQAFFNRLPRLNVEQLLFPFHMRGWFSLAWRERRNTEFTDVTGERASVSKGVFFVLQMYSPLNGTLNGTSIS